MDKITQSLNQLKIDKDQLAMEFFSLDESTKFLKGLLPSILSSFTNTSSLVELPELNNISKDQHVFLKLMKDVPYVEISDLKAYVPEGMSSLYMTYLDTLLPVTKALKSIQGDVLQPYALFLAQLVSDKQAALTTKSMKQEYAKLDANREHVYKAFSKLYDKDSYKAETKVKYVIQRNNDWQPILHKLNECIGNVQSIDREAIKRHVAQCVDYLKIIQSNLERDENTKTSREAGSYLADGAYSVAKELELFSTTYYRALTMKGSIENTVAYITKIVG